jgi:hypothetical protein
MSDMTPPQVAAVALLVGAGTTLAQAAPHGWAEGRRDGSILSLGSKGSILSIGSVGSILSIGSIGSVLSLGSIGSFGSLGSIASALSVRSLFSWLSDSGVLAAGHRSH